MAELEKERDSLLNAMARREEEFSTLQGQLEYTQLKLSSTQASNRLPWADHVRPYTPGLRRCIHGGWGL